MIENNNNEILSKNKENKEDGMSNLLQKLNFQLEENKKKTNLKLPNYEFDLDLDFDVDFSKEIKNKNPEEKNNIINIEENKENKKEQGILKNKNIKENLKLIKHDKDNENNVNNNLKLNKNHNENTVNDNMEINKSNDDDKKISVNNLEENFENEKENKANKKEDKEMKKSESEEQWDLLTSVKDKDEKKDINNNNNFNLIEDNIKKGNNSEDDNKSEQNNNNNNINNLEEHKEDEKKTKEKISNKKNTDSIYESFDEIGEEFENRITQNNNNVNLNNENNKENSQHDSDIKNPNDENNKGNENINNINTNINNNKSSSVEIEEEIIKNPEINLQEKKDEENNINNLSENNNNNSNNNEGKDNNVSSNLFISEREEINSKKSEHSQKSENSKKSEEQANNSDQNQKINIKQIPSSIEIQEVPKRNSVDENQEKDESNIKNMKISDEDDKKKIKEILKKVKEFRKKKIEENKDKFEKYPIVDLDFNYHEKTLDDLIPNLSNKIKENELSKEVEKRKFNFMAHSYFEGFISTNPLLQIVPECKIAHIDLMRKIYEEQGLKNIPKISEENYEKKIFEKNNYDDNSSINSTIIGEVESLENFLYKYHLENNEEISTKSYKYFPYWRCIESDGNSFYRGIMFAIFENFIIKNLREQLNQIISEITCNKFVEIYTENNINYETPFYIFGVILYLLEKNKIEEAYNLFIKSYSLKDNSFDKILIMYLRYISFDYVEEILELSKDEEILKKCDTKIHPENYNINKELIKTMNIEPNFFIICLMPYLFDINLLIYYLDRDLTKPKEGLVKLIDEDYPDLPFISLGYFFSSFHRIYWKQWVNEEPIIKKYLMIIIL